MAKNLTATKRIQPPRILLKSPFCLHVLLLDAMERHTDTDGNLVNIWWLVGVTLVAAFDFSPGILGGGGDQ